MVNYLDLPVGDNAPESFGGDSVSKDGHQKFEYDKKLHVFKLDRNLHSPVHYPGDYGCIPSSLSDDGDPLDVLVLVPDRSFPGCVQEVRPIGLLEMLDQGISTRRFWPWARTIRVLQDLEFTLDIYPIC